MHFLLLNQTFHPDVMATGQYLTEVAVALAEQGHQVTVVTSRRAYDDPTKRFPRTETWRGIRIIRIGSTGFGKAAKWRRAADFASFLLLCTLQLALLPQPDVVLALTSPPLISFLGACLARFRRARFVYWVMDFNPDEAIAAGWLRAGSFPAKILESISRFSLRHAYRIIALDHYMRDRILAKGIAPEKVSVLAPWSHDEQVAFDPPGRQSFRTAQQLDGKFVVMYSGNHSPVHPLDTVLRAAERLRDDKDLLFLFVGGGSEWRKIKELSTDAGLPLAASGGEGVGERWPVRPPASPKSECQNFNISESPHLTPQLSTNLRCLPYQPIEQLSASLSAADLHVVVMGDPFVGLVHPCKIYNILGVGAPVLYIGPEPSHVSELLLALGPAYPCASVRHGDVQGAVEAIRRLRHSHSPDQQRAAPPAHRNFSKDTVLPQLLNLLTRDPSS